MFEKELKRNLSVISTLFIYHFMLSINIPVFNIVVNDLVFQLVQQAEELNILYEIRVYDDGSAEKIKTINREITDFRNVVYFEMETNLGRSAIRNKMGFDAKYENLLFIDADSKIIKHNYLETYLLNAKRSCVLCGGTAYGEEKPFEKEKILRWTYGTTREALSAEERNRKKGFIITSNNFLIPTKIFRRIYFREDIKNYGHEDTVLGFDLFKNRIEIVHVDNPVEHTGLEDAGIFIQKSKTALKNLKYISETVLGNDTDFMAQVYFLNRFHLLSEWLPLIFLRWFYSLFHALLEKNLRGKNPEMKWFDLYKLTYFSTIKKP